MRPPTWIQFRPVRLEPAVDRGRRDLQQQARRRIIDLELVEPQQPGHQIRHRRRQQTGHRRHTAARAQSNDSSIPATRALSMSQRVLLTIVEKTV